MKNDCFIQKAFVNPILVDTSLSTRNAGKAKAEQEGLTVIFPAITEMAKEAGAEAQFMVLGFNSKAEWLVGPEPKVYEEIKQNGPLQWTPKGATGMAGAIDTLLHDTPAEILPPRMAAPAIILITDGKSTDPEYEMERAIAELHSHPVWGRGIILPIALGEDEFDFEQLLKISNQNVVFIAKDVSELRPVLEFVAFSAAEKSIGSESGNEHETIGEQLANRTMYGMEYLGDTNYLVDPAVYEVPADEPAYEPEIESSEDMI